MTRRTGYRVGPGCYNYPISTNKGVSANIRPDSAIPSNPAREIEYVYVEHSLFKQEIAHPRHISQSMAGTRTSFGGSPIRGSTPSMSGTPTRGITPPRNLPEPELSVYNPPFMRTRRFKVSQQPEDMSFMEPSTRSPVMNRSRADVDRSLSARR